ncbi:uncharacterized protein LACBIDRAFT_308103 [Laccaria bicolor S238N-H82]|uniref:Predicted protein n=1 Tax=Laccaria bicolor (strain S238N-H82 / ATCC MYA-4686) TaxID=486041 RepID=B0DRN2_LACBS|nr:uncharacterized protein LACBIDRAFT_308103 [Laccaria bicolor S238N-H82]EDR02814.1 predicted protein [Laccaria bicolor S238N-H82]|eukprot:XP_001886524.1 predicted protein [Laccaria bicolor S238N-H82]
MLDRFRSRQMPSSTSLLQRFHTMFKRRGQPTNQSEKKPHSSALAIQSNGWNIPLPPDLMYHIIDTYLATSAIIALCIAFPVLRSFCHPQPYRHITVYIHKAWLPSQKLFIRIELSECPPTLEQDNSISLSTLDDLGYAGTEKARGVLSLVSDLTHDLTSIHLDITVKWNELDKYVKVYIFALLQRSGLRSATLKSFDFPVNLLGVVQNLKTLDVDTSLGCPDNVYPPGERGKVYVEEVRLRGGLQHCLIGPRTPFNWSKLRAIEYYGYRGNLQELLELCSSSLQVLELAIYGEDEYIDLGVLADLRHLTLSISLTNSNEQAMYANPGTHSSIMPFRWVPYMLASCNEHNAVEKIVLILSTVDRQDLRRCDWRSVDKIFEREGTWMSLKEVLVVNCNFDEHCTYRELQPDQLEYIEASPTPCLQAREVINWRQYVKDIM